ncbi:GNAT family N-acetyltransferase [Streptomyces sp. BE147]|uniref:GNAT family N-acetyltransferase n=1 Tax=Streptomyces sp. BE147 TaxID=3002524 RepID=UPI002E7736A1|nr:GNAT family N-acetyltransferase [Streptomyces sp. BE147]MEE1736440.1 GNAT family N-acetyltransferase [Streptomyces sp. BE147]
MTVLPEQYSTVRTSWHRTVASLPDERPTPTPFHSRQWAAAWQGPHIESALSQRHLLLNDGQYSHRLSYQLSDTNALWKTLESVTRRRHSVFSGPVVYAPSLYSQYGGLPGASTLVLAEAVDRGRQMARETDAQALVIPNLAPVEAAQWTRIRPPDAQVRLFHAHRTLLGAGLQEFAARIPTSKARTQFQRQHSRGTAAGLRLRVVSGAALQPVLPAVHALLEDEARSQTTPRLYSLPLLNALTGIPGALALLAEESDGTLAGAFIGFRHGTTLYLWAETVAHERVGSYTFGWLLAESIRHAAATGVRVLDAGRGHPSFKRHLGMTPVPLTAACYLTKPDARAVSGLREMDTALEAHRRA